MNIKLFQRTMVLTSSLKVEDLLIVARFAPSKLAITEGEEGNEVFRVGYGTVATISKYGVVFNEIHEDNTAVAVFTLPDNLPLDARVEFINEKYGQTLLNLMTMEETIPQLAREIEANKVDISRFIEIIG